MNRVLEQTIHLDIKWEGQAGFLVRGFHADKELLHSEFIRLAFFGWHPKSFYGTMLLESQVNTEALCLDPVLAIDYFAEPKPLDTIQVDFGEGFDILREISVIYKDALQNGWYRPFAQEWEGGQAGCKWQLQLPELTSARCKQLLSQADAAGMTFLAEWFQEAVRWLIKHDEHVKQAWTALIDKSPLLKKPSQNLQTVDSETAALWFDEKEWLIQTGWSRDNIPFSVSLQLKEPDAVDVDWRLEAVLLDKQDEAYYNCRFNGQAVEDELPVAWNEYLSYTMKRISQKSIQVCPELTASNDQGGIKEVLSVEEVWSFLTEWSVRLAEAGIHVLLPAWWEEIRKTKPRLKAKMKSSVGSAKNPMFGLNQIVEFDWKIAVGNEQLSEEEFKQVVSSKHRLIQLHGRWIALDSAMLSQVQKQMKQLEKRGLTLREALENHLTQMNEDSDDFSEADSEQKQDDDTLIPIEVDVNEHMLDLLNQLQQTKEIPTLSVPQGFQGEMRPYQIQGFSWMVFLHRFGLGGCLADDMGLGKTVQWIAYLLHLKEKNKLNTPALLICPTSVLGNWQKELQRFAPSLQIQLHYGSRRSKQDTFLEDIENVDLVITSYTLAHIDADELSQVEWSSLCLDEAQNIKNAYTKQSKAVRELKAIHSIALTGTPIENRLTELWSIFDFINPRYLGSLTGFNRRYVHPIERTNDTKLITQVQRLIQPFLLRRVKKDPAIQLDLPDKNEMKTYVKLTKDQAAMYENILQHLFETIDRLPPMERRGAVLASLTKLKQICNDPYLFLKKSEGSSDFYRSNKLVRLLEMVKEVREEGERCLIFTQFVEMGKLIQNELNNFLNEKPLFLHGGVAKASRDRMIQSFQQASLDDKTDLGIFVLSLKAGGTGLNLTAANHVFHFDRWWNPAVEDQATDRAYRIGQSRDVQVHKMITLGTLEERIDEMLEQKQGWSKKIVGGGESWVTEMSTGELRDIFALRKDWIE
jgi:SNF2 family DNA or RNA helicase